MLHIQKAHKQGFAFSFQGRKLSSQYNPLQEGERILRWQNLNQAELVFFLGFFPVYHIAKALQDFEKQEKQNKVRWFIFESLALSHKDVDTALLKVGLKNPQQRAYLWSILGAQEKLSSFVASLPQAQSLSKALIIKSPYMPKADRDLFQQSLARISRRRHAQQITQQYFSLLWQINRLNNLRQPCLTSRLEKPSPHTHAKESFLLQPRYFIDSLSLEKTATQQGVNHKLPATAIALLSGLSSEHQLKHLKESARYFPIFTAAGMVPWLKKHGIAFDAVMTSDGGQVNALHFHWCSEKNITDFPCQKTSQERPLPLDAAAKPSPAPPLIASLSTSLHCLQLYASFLQNQELPKPHALPICLYIDDKDIFEALANAKQYAAAFLEMDGSLVHCMIRLLAKLGFQNIMSFGIDFSYTGFQSHASGYTLAQSCFHKAKKLSSFDTLALPLFAGMKKNKTQAPAPAPAPAPQAPYAMSDSKLLLYQERFLHLQKQLKQQYGTNIFRAESSQAQLVTSQAKQITVNTKPSKLWSLKFSPKPYTKQQLANIHTAIKSLSMPLAKETFSKQVMKQQKPIQAEFYREHHLRKRLTSLLQNEACFA